MILKNALNHGGRLYLAGEDVKGKLPLDMIQLLQEKGGFEDVIPLENPSNGEGFLPTRSVAELEEYLQSVDSKEELESLLTQEKQSDQPRASAIKVLEKRLKEMQSE